MTDTKESVKNGNIVAEFCNRFGHKKALSNDFYGPVINAVFCEDNDYKKSLNDMDESEIDSWMEKEADIISWINALLLYTEELNSSKEV